ncbi:toxin-antitoxin system YwqK family antitoxin [Acinetobacter gerneri]|uniref:toxin-antitoxin system YwqK family antitoxin n=1 Tax=Acinetobacter gerneri TaxID=202952 RepID=UPI0028ABFF68|nr:membrane-binding protein [Acinetobacter gerneri]
MNIKTIGFLGAMLGLPFTGCTSLNQQPKQIQISTMKSLQLSTAEPILAYFSKESGTSSCGCDTGYSKTAVEDGYYRKLLGRDINGRYYVQDFYQENSKPQTEPFWIKDPEGLNSFQSSYVDGPITILSKNGKTIFKATIQDYELIGISQSFYQNGQLAQENDYERFGEIHQKLWYENGKPAADAVLDLDYQIIKAQFWNLQGELVTDDDEIQAIADAIEQKTAL